MIEIYIFFSYVKENHYGSHFLVHIFLPLNTFLTNLETYVFLSFLITKNFLKLPS